jgi:hypothetical protein
MQIYISGVIIIKSKFRLLKVIFHHARSLPWSFSITNSVCYSKSNHIWKRFWILKHRANSLCYMCWFIVGNSCCFCCSCFIDKLEESFDRFFYQNNISWRRRKPRRKSTLQLNWLNNYALFIMLLLSWNVVLFIYIYVEKIS